MNCNGSRQEWIKAFKKFENITELDRAAVIALVKQVRVYGKDRIEVIFNFQEETERHSSLIALYIRLSQEDCDVSLRADKSESNSITNQRALLWDFIKNHEEFADCTVIEKCNDGYSGVHFDSRPAFTELIEFAKAGKVNCIIVKDFSRFGRNW